LIFVLKLDYMSSGDVAELLIMHDRSMNEIFAALGDALVDDFYQITREAHETYRSYEPSVLVEHDVRAQASCTYAHMVAAADRRFIGRDGVKPLDIRGLKVWLFEQAGVVVRFKKMDEDGRTRNYPTNQALNFDKQRHLPGLPPEPVRLAAGYVLDATGTELLRSQISCPNGRDVLWCGAIVPHQERRGGEPIWVDVTRQGRFG
jgi:hypothetical protein